MAVGDKKCETCKGNMIDVKVSAVISLLAVQIAVCLSAGVSGGGGHGGGEYYDEHPDPFHFKYGVHDDKYYTDFGEERHGDEYGNMEGEYYVHLPDGRVLHVKYHADGNYGGTIMDVTYEGEAPHPDYHGKGHGGHV